MQDIHIPFQPHSMVLLLLDPAFYCLCYYSCPRFSSFLPLHPAPTLPQAISTLLSMFMGPAYMFFDYSLPYAVHSHDYSITTNLYFLILSLFSLIPLAYLPLATIKTFSISVCLFLFCFLVYFFRFNS